MLGFLCSSFGVPVWLFAQSFKMAACKSVVVLCPNARRQTVKVGPTTTILQILEEVCKKQGLSSLEHAIKHQRKILDETLPIRYSGLSNNAHLEIVPQTKSNKQDAPCTIALQLASGERLLKEFPPAHSLWDVIQHWNSQQDSPHHQKLLGEEGQDVVCVYMTQRVSGELTLKKTTLHSLGLTGKRAIIRLLHEEASSSNPEQVSTKPTTTSSLQEQESSQQPLKTPNITIPGNMNTPSSLQQEPHAEQSTIPVSEEPKTSSASSMEVQETQDKQTENRHRQLDVKTVSPDRAARDPKRTRIAGPNPLFPDFKFPDRPLAEASKSQAPIVTEERLHYLGTPCERCAVVYRENDETITLTNQDVPDSFYEVTVDDIQKMLQHLHSERSKSEDMPLLTKAMRESRKIEELTKYEKVVIRIKFPDRLILQGFFRPQEKVSTLTEFVKSHLEDPNELFDLYTTPPKTVFKNQNDTLYNVHLCPAALVYFGAKDKKETYLASHLLDNLVTALDAEKSVVDSGIRGLSSTPTARPCMPQTLNNVNTATNNTNTTSNNSASSTNNAAPLPRGASGKVPKWFKGVGK